MSNLLNILNQHFNSIHTLPEEENLLTFKNNFDENIYQSKKSNIHYVDYFSPLNPVFLNHFLRPEFLSKFKVVLVRDGINGLWDFFKKYPICFGKEFILIIPCDLYFLVPNGWLKQCTFYRRSFKDKSGLPKNTLIIDGLCNDYDINLNEIKRLLDNLSNFDNVIVTIEPKSENIALFNNIINLIMNSFSKKIELAQPQTLFEKDLTKAVYLDLNTAPFSYYDSYVRFNILESGATPLKDVNNWSSRSIKFFHGFFQEIEIFECLDESKLHKNNSFQSQLNKNNNIKLKDNADLLNLISSYINHD